MKLKVGDLVSWSGHRDSIGMVVRVYEHKVWRTAEHGKKVDWSAISPEPFASVAFDGQIRKIPQVDLEKLNHESR